VKQSNYSEVRDRRRLGKRILKSLEPYFEAALKAEADICSKSFDSMKQELEAMIEASLEVRQQTTSSIIVSHDDGAAPKPDQDVDMMDAPAEGQIIVADQSDDEADADGEADPDHDDTKDGTELAQDHGGEIEVKEPDDEHDDDGTLKPNGARSSAHSPPGDQQSDIAQGQGDFHRGLLVTNGFNKDPNSNSPASLPGSYPHPANHQDHQDHGHDQNPHPAPAPLTPPQSNGSFAGQPSNQQYLQQQPAVSSSLSYHNGSSNSSNDAVVGTSNDAVVGTSNDGSSDIMDNVLVAGGIPWYLAGFELRGTSAVEEQWTGREAVRRALSEELTDMDDDALKDLEFDVDEENTITASPPVGEGTDGNGANNNSGGGSGAGSKAITQAAATPKKSLRSSTASAAAAAAAVAAATASGASRRASNSGGIRKGVRSSARRR
jgi:NuA3 HAT complex component NTO1